MVAYTTKQDDSDLGHNDLTIFMVVGFPHTLLWSFIGNPLYSIIIGFLAIDACLVFEQLVFVLIQQLNRLFPSCTHHVCKIHALHTFTFLSFLQENMLALMRLN